MNTKELNEVWQKRIDDATLADKRLAELDAAWIEMRCVDDVALDQGLAVAISQLQAHRERLWQRIADMEDSKSVEAFLQSDIFHHAVCMWMWETECPEGDPDEIVWTNGPTPESYGPAYLAAFDSHAFSLRERIKHEIALWDEAEKQALIIQPTEKKL